jgi:hypothetical protein
MNAEDVQITKVFIDLKNQIWGQEGILFSSFEDAKRKAIYLIHKSSKKDECKKSFQQGLKALTVITIETATVKELQNILSLVSKFGWPSREIRRAVGMRKSKLVLESHKKTEPSEKQVLDSLLDDETLKKEDTLIKPPEFMNIESLMKFLLLERREY